MPPIFDNKKEEQSYRELLEALAEWHPKAPRMQGNHALLAKVEKNLPVLYEALYEKPPIELPDGSLPTALPKREGNKFIHRGELFTWESNPDGASQTYKEGDELPIHPFRGARSEDGAPDEFIKTYWQPWLDADLLTQKALRTGLEGEPPLDKDLYTSWVHKARGSDRVKSLVPPDYAIKLKETRKILGEDTNPEDLSKHVTRANRNQSKQSMEK